MTQRALVFIKHVIEYAFFKLAPARHFEFDGRRYRYFYAFYNATWIAERKLEIPIFRRMVQDERGPILEVGNVLAHYLPIGHTVVDKYEQGPGVINCDVIDYAPEQRFDLIVSISTLEHVGINEEVTDADKARRAVEHLVSLLRPGGRLVFSIPTGHNPSLDEYVRTLEGRQWRMPVHSQGLSKHPPKELCIVEIRK